MTPNHLASIFRDVAKKTGIKWDEGDWNPLRPKRLRHLFRTACDTAGVNELYINAFMGHVNGMGQSYSEIDSAKLELEYLRVEPFLTVYGESEEILRIKTDIEKDRDNQQRIINGMLAENMELKEKYMNLEKESDRRFKVLEDTIIKMGATYEKILKDVDERREEELQRIEEERQRQEELDKDEEYKKVLKNIDERELIEEDEEHKGSLFDSPQ